MRTHNLEEEGDEEEGDIIAVKEREFEEYRMPGALRCCGKAIGKGIKGTLRAVLCPIMSLLALLLAIAVVVLVIVVVVLGPAMAQEDAEILVTSTYERFKHMLPAWAVSSSVGPQRRWLETQLTVHGVRASGYVDLEPTRICANITQELAPMVCFTTFDAEHNTFDRAWIGAGRGCFTTNTTLVLGGPGVQHFVEFYRLFYRDGMPSNDVTAIVRLL